MNFSRVTEAFSSIPYGVRRFLKIICLGLAGVFFIFMSLWVFFPWKAAAELALAKAAEGGARQGVVFSANGVSSSGVLFPVISVAKIQVNNSFIDMKCLNLTLELNPFAFFTTGSVKGVLRLGDGNFILPDKQQVKWGSGYAEIFAHMGGADVSSIMMQGDISLGGSLSARLGERISSDITLKAPPALDKTLMMMEYSLPLQRVGEGEWRSRSQ